MGGVDVLAYLVGMLISMVISVGISMLTKPTKDTSSAKMKRSGHQVNTRNSEEPVPIIYGTITVGGNFVYITTSGEENKYLHLILVLAEGECKGIYQLDGVDQIFIDDEIYTNFKKADGSATVVYEFFNGSPHQTLAGTTLISNLPDFTDNMRNTCFLYLRLEFDPDVYQSMPGVKVKLEGRKIFDTRDQTWKFSNNCAMVLRDFMVNKRFGKGEDQSKIDKTTFDAVATTLETKGWTFDGIIFRDESASSIVENMLTNFRGGLIYSADGTYKLVYMDTNYESNSMDLDEDDIVEGTIGIMESSAYDCHNTLRFTLLDEDINYQPNEFTLHSATFDSVTEEENPATIDFNGITNFTKASKMASYYMDREVLSQRVEFVALERCLALEPFDLITLTNSFLGWVSQTLRVVSVKPLENHTVGLSCIIENTSLYDDEVNVNTHLYSTTTLINPKAAVPSVWGVEDSETVYNYRLRSFTRWDVTFNPPANYPWFDHIEVWYSADGFVTSRFMFTATEDFAIDPIEEDKAHWLKLRVVNIFGVKEPLTSCYSLARFIIGKDAAPTSLTELIVTCQDDSVYLYSQKVDDPDVELYEFRLGSAWATAVFLVANRNPSFSLKGIKPGVHTFWCNTLSNNGIYGEVAVSAVVVTNIDPPKSWVANAAGDWAGGDPVNDFDDPADGTHSNTEKYDSGGGDYRLRCTHTGGVLVGTFTSKVYDSGANDTYLAYLRATIAVMGAGTSWDDKIELVTTGAQLVTNGDFEAGLTGWTGVFASLSLNTATPFAGTNSLIVSCALGHGYAHRLITVTAGKWYVVRFRYKQTVGLGEIGFYDESNGAHIVPETYAKLASATDWAEEDYVFYAPAGCTSISVRLGGQSSGSTVHYDNFYIYQVDETNSPTWESVEVGDEYATRWDNVFASTQAIRVAMKIQWGDAADPATWDIAAEAKMMEILTTVATGRYFRFIITITDPDPNIYGLIDDVEFALCT